MEVNISVKDKNNLFSHNLWSGSSYNKSISSSEYVKGTGVTISSSQDCSYIGDYSVKLTVIDNSRKWGRFNVPYSPSDIGKTVKASAMIYSKNISVSCNLLFLDSTRAEIGNISTIVKSNNFEYVELSNVIPEQTNSIYFNVTADANELYVDDLMSMIS